MSFSRMHHGFLRKKLAPIFYYILGIAIGQFAISILIFDEEHVKSDVSSLNTKGSFNNISHP